MTDWLKRYAVIDGRKVTEPVIQGSDTTFNVTGASNWGSTSKYNVHLQGPDSYYQYTTLSEPKDDASAGGNRQEKITITGNNPERLNRYRSYINTLSPEDYKYWWQQIFSKADGGKVLKGDEGMLTEAAKNIAKKFGWIESRREETEPLIVRNIETNPYVTNNQYTVEDPTYGRVITSYKVPGLSNDTSWYMRPGTMQTIIPGGVLGKTILEPTDGKYILRSWDRVPVDINEDDNKWIKNEIFVPESEAKKQKYWFRLPHPGKLTNYQYNHNTNHVPGENEYKFKQGGRLMRQGGKIIEVSFE